MDVCIYVYVRIKLKATKCSDSQPEWVLHIGLHGYICMYVPYVCMYMREPMRRICRVKLKMIFGKSALTCRFNIITVIGSAHKNGLSMGGN